MRLHKASDRAKIQSWIGTYKTRREEMRERYGVERQGFILKCTEDYKRASENINNRIRNWEKAINMIDKRNNQVMAVANQLALFTGINVKNSIRNTSSEHRLTRNLFYKYCLENDISATYVAEYVGASRGDIVARGRLKFTNGFAKHPENKEKWINFKRYLEEHNIENSGDNQ